VFGSDAGTADGCSDEDGASDAGKTTNGTADGSPTGSSNNTTAPTAPPRALPPSATDGSPAGSSNNTTAPTAPPRALPPSAADGSPAGSSNNTTAPTAPPRALPPSAADGMRNDFLQRCIAVSLRALTRASEDGVTAPVAGLSSVLLVPRVVGLVVDQEEERSLLVLMGHQCRFFCSPCMEDKNMSGGVLGVRAVDRDVTTTIEAQLVAALVRAEDPRPSRRRHLAQEHSALVFVPALGAVPGLGTGANNLYRIVCFDLLHVWKLGILRLLAQRLPAVLTALCGARGAARLGSVQATLEALNWRGFELGRNCKVTPSEPGYVFLMVFRIVPAYRSLALTA